MEAAITSRVAQDQFLLLLTTQLRHQDPLSPTKQEEFMGQLAQFSTLEQMEKMNKGFEQLLKVQQDQLDHQAQMRDVEQLAKAATLIGKHVLYDMPSSNSQGGDDASPPDDPRRGIVQSINFTGDEPLVRIGQDQIPFNHIREIVLATA